MGISTNDSHVANKDLVLFVVYELGGAEKSVHTEDIAHKICSYPLGRKRYGWEKYPYPDKKRITRELYRLKNVDGMKLVRGHTNVGSKKDRIDGWILTPAGVDRIKQIEETLRAIISASAGKGHRYTEDNLRQRIVQSSCFKIYSEDPQMVSAKNHNFTDMLYCLPDASTEKIRAAYDKLMASVKATDSGDLINFLDAARKRFANLLSD